MHRRSFITGVGAAVVASVIPIAAGAKVISCPAVSNPLMEVEAFLEAMSQQMAQTIIYGNPDWEPTQFTGLRLHVDAPNAP